MGPGTGTGRKEGAFLVPHSEKGSPPRRFLMLQGPHGPFFGQLGRMLRAAGAEVWRVGFNRGDAFFWRGPGYIAYRDTPESWPAAFAQIAGEKRISDLVLYGEGRPIHAQAISIAASKGIRVHVFEEGYLRPYWATYERGGANGNSRLMSLSLAAIRAAISRPEFEHPEAPAHWGDMHQHVFYGALYHFLVLTMNGRYRNFHPHRGISVGDEFRLHLRRLLLMPWHRFQRMIATGRIRMSRFPYHLVLLQLEHDASFRLHSDFTSMPEFISTCIEGFRAGAPPHHHMVFKAHPLEDGRSAVAATIRQKAAELGIGRRVHFVRGGKLAWLLDGARSAVTVNSTSGQQVLWRGLPLKAFGRAVYGKPEFTSSQPLAEFFRTPGRPDTDAYREYRRFLLETSQVPGGYYSRRGRRHLLGQVVEMILADHDPYDALATGKAAPRQQLRISRTPY
ncbi:MAG: capsule biosynthesis protein CapA [Rhodobacteraceae bacterium]|nr:capsule biosynthesis protein CapA [Paracoccaceae bacterium]